VTAVDVFIRVAVLVEVTVLVVSFVAVFVPVDVKVSVLVKVGGVVFVNVGVSVREGMVVRVGGIAVDVLVGGICKPQTGQGLGKFVPVKFVMIPTNV